MFFKIFSKKQDLPKGRAAEDKAARFLEKKGLSILARNYHSRFGEIDIIAQDDEILHFVEVKSSQNYDALERITASKMEKIVKTIEFWLLKNGADRDYQIDAIVVRGDEIEWLENII